MNILEIELRAALERLSNGDSAAVTEEMIDEAAEEFKAAIRKQLAGRDDEFRLRASNIGRPLCQLQMERAGAPRTRRPYSFITKMLIGDITEIVLNLVIKAAGLNVTGSKRKVALDLAGETIKGENDIEIDGKVYDIKSMSPYAYRHKSKSYDDFKDGDAFGYIGQMALYSEGSGVPPGGWICTDKSSGEVAVVEYGEDDLGHEEVIEELRGKVLALKEGREFARCFAPEPETYYRKPTGKYTLPITCTFCEFLGSCWPTAEYKPQENSKAEYPKYKWYVDVNE